MFELLFFQGGVRDSEQTSQRNFQNQNWKSKDTSEFHFWKYIHFRRKRNDSVVNINGTSLTLRPAVICIAYGQDEFIEFMFDKTMISGYIRIKCLLLFGVRKDNKWSVFFLLFVESSYINFGQVSLSEQKYNFREGNFIIFKSSLQDFQIDFEPWLSIIKESE